MQNWSDAESKSGDLWSQDWGLSLSIYRRKNLSVFFIIFSLLMNKPYFLALRKVINVFKFIFIIFVHDRLLSEIFISSLRKNYCISF